MWTIQLKKLPDHGLDPRTGRKVLLIKDIIETLSRTFKYEV